MARKQIKQFNKEERKRNTPTLFRKQMEVYLMCACVPFNLGELML
jgi:hypothetical protein